MKNGIKMSVAAVVAIVAAALSTEAAALSGAWRGELALGEMKIPLVLNFDENGEGETICTMDFLARNGVASFRYDDRGTGQSGGDFLKATTYTFKDDARSGVEFMRGIPGIGATGVIGHSEGGTIAFMLGAEGVPDFIISLAGMAIRGKEALMAQNSRQLDRSGIAGQDKENSLALISRLFDEMAAQRAAAPDAVGTINPDSLARASRIIVPESVMASLRATQKLRTPWFDTLLAIDPGESIAHTKCPVLAINGDKDTQVEAAPNLRVIGDRCPGAEVRLMPSLNHMMQHALPGDISEYDEIRETISPEVLELMLDFIRRHSR